MKFFDAGAASYKASVIKISAGIGLAAAAVIFRLLVKLPENAERAAGAACVIVIILLLIIAVAGAAEAGFVKLNRNKKLAERGEAKWLPADVPLREIYGLAEVSDIISISFITDGKPHNLCAKSECGALAGYAYAREYAMDEHTFSSLDELANSEISEKLGLRDPDSIIRVTAINGTDPKYFLGGK